MSEDCRDTYRDDYELWRRCEALVWSELVDRHIDLPVLIEMANEAH